MRSRTDPSAERAAVVHLDAATLSALRALVTSGSGSLLPDELLDGGRPTGVALALAAALVAPMVVVHVERRVAAESARADIRWTPAASVALGGAVDPDTGTRPAIVSPPDQLGMQVVRTAHLAARPAAPVARQVPAAEVAGTPAHLLQTVEITTTAPHPDLPDTRDRPPLAAPVARMLVDGIDGLWRVGPTDPSTPATLALEPWSADQERDVHDRLAARLLDEAVPSDDAAPSAIPSDHRGA